MVPVVSVAVLTRTSNSLVHDGVGWVRVGKVKTAIGRFGGVTRESTPWFTPSL